MKNFNLKGKVAKRKTNVLKKAYLTVSTVIMMTVLQVSMFAQEGMPSGSGNAIQESTIWKGFQKLLSDLGVVLMIAVPIIGGILVAVFAIIRATQAEPHDKEKWGKNIKNVLIGVAIAFGASSLMAILASYFNN